MKRRLSYSCYTEVRCATVVATLSSAAANAPAEISDGSCYCGGYVSYLISVSGLLLDLLLLLMMFMLMGVQVANH